MGERAGQIAKVPEVKQSNSNSLVRRTERLQSMDTLVERILFLQKTAGNQAVSRLMKSGALQAKLRIGQPGDVYEQEADRVADEVMRMPEPEMQRQVGEEEEEEMLQTKPLVDQITPLVQRQVEEEEEEELLQAKPLVDQITPLVQRQVEEEEEEELLQAISMEDTTPEVSNDLESQINAIKGGGLPLGEYERAYFEPRFGADFSQVKVHTNTQAAESAQVLNAQAYTVGRDVVFGVGQYSPGTASGNRLLAHELTHVIQQELQPDVIQQESVTDENENAPEPPGYDEEEVITHTVQQTGGQNLLSYHRAEPNVIQLTQIGRITTPSTGTPYFTYQLDASISDLNQLAVFYGTDRSGIVSMNPGATETVGNRIQVPAINPPAPATGMMGGSGRPSIVTGSVINARWNPNTSSNRVGQLRNGAHIPEVFSNVTGVYTSAFVDPFQMMNQATGIINELRQLRLVSGPSSVGNYVLAYVPSGSVTQRTANAQNALTYAYGELIKGVAESPACTNRGPDVDNYTAVTGPTPVISGNRFVSGVCGQAWCAYFVRWCLNQAGISNSVTGAALSVKTWGQSQRWYHLVSVLTPMAGDIFFKRPSGSTGHPCDTNPCVSSGPGSGHVGFVTGIAGSSVNTLEGNVNISSTNDGITSKTRPFTDLEGFVRIP